MRRRSSRWPSRATTSSRSSSRRARRPSRKAWSSPIATCSPTSSRSKRRSGNTGNTAGRSSPSGSSTSCRSVTCSDRRWPPSCRRCSHGTVVFMRGYNPHEIVRQMKKRRISVLVSVPKILDVLADHVARLHPDVRAACRHGKESVAKRWWRYRAVHRLFGLKFWSFVVGAAPLESSLESFWGRLGFVVVQGYGLTETAPIVTLNHPFSTSKGSVGKADRRRRHQDRARRRNSRARRQRHDRLLRRARSDRTRHSKEAGSTPATSASSMRRAGCSSAAARKK